MQSTDYYIREHVYRSYAVHDGKVPRIVIPLAQLSCHGELRASLRLHPGHVTVSVSPWGYHADWLKRRLYLLFILT